MTHVNALKGLSILFIVAFHICGQIFYSEPKWFRPLSYQGVNVFFLLSGVGLTYSILSKKLENQKITKWIYWYIKRGIRILPLYWLILLITFLIYIFDLNIIRIAANKQSGSAIFDFVTHFFLIHIYYKKTYFSINVAWWFLATIVHFYLLFPLIINIYKHKLLQFPLIGIVAIIFWLNKQQNFIPNQIAISFIFFFLGIVLTFFDIEHVNKFITSHSYILSLTLLSLSIFTFCSLNGYITKIFKTYTYELFAFFLTSLLYIISIVYVNMSAKSLLLKPSLTYLNSVVHIHIQYFYYIGVLFIQ